MSCDGLTLGKNIFGYIHSNSSFTSPATCFECYDGTGTTQRWGEDVSTMFLREQSTITSHDRLLLRSK